MHTLTRRTAITGAAALAATGAAHASTQPDMTFALIEAHKTAEDQANLLADRAEELEDAWHSSPQSQAFVPMCVGPNADVAQIAEACIGAQSPSQAREAVLSSATGGFLEYRVLGSDGTRETIERHFTHMRSTYCNHGSKNLSLAAYNALLSEIEAREASSLAVLAAVELRMERGKQSFGLARAQRAREEGFQAQDDALVALAKHLPTTREGRAAKADFLTAQYQRYDRLDSAVLQALIASVKG